MICLLLMDACRVLGLLHDDELWFSTMEDSKDFHMPSQMRELFTTLMVFTELSDPKRLFEAYWVPMAEDYMYLMRQIRHPAIMLPRYMVLIDIEERLQATGHSHLSSQLDEITEEMRYIVSNAKRRYTVYHECIEIQEELNYDKEEMKSLLDKALNGEGPYRYGKFTASQEVVFKSVTQAIEGRNSNKLFFLHARAGTGKTFLLNRLLYYARLREQDGIGLAIAFSGVAATLLHGLHEPSRKFILLVIFFVK